MKKELFILPCIAAIVIATFVGTKTFESNMIDNNELLLANVEAITQSDTQSVKHYSSMHLVCFKNVKYGTITTTVPSGKHSATCWENENSTKGYHSHTCDNCNSN